MSGSSITTRRTPKAAIDGRPPTTRWAVSTKCHFRVSPASAVLRSVVLAVAAARFFALTGGQALASARSPADPRPTRSLRLRLFLPAVVIAVVIIALGAAPASATFPGPDGRIAFNAFIEKTESFGIFTAKPDGSDVRMLTSTPDTLSGLPDWSPDAERIAFYNESFRPGPPAQVYVMNADGSDVTQLTTGHGFKGLPSWAPDADSLAIVADWGDTFSGGSAGDLDHPRLGSRRGHPGGGSAGDDPPAGFDADIDPQFSPDGSSIAFARFKSERKSAIHRVGIDGTGLERLTPWRLNASDPDWSPDGQRIAFDSGDAEAPGSKGNIYVMRADGSGRTRLTDHPPLRRGAARSVHGFC